MNVELTYNDKDPLWISSRIKSLIERKNNIFQKLLKDPFDILLRQKFNTIQEKVVVNLENSKQSYYWNLSQNLISNQKVNPNFFWSMLKTLVIDSKIPCIPPLIVDDKFISDFQKKAELFNDSFAKQCFLIDNDSSLLNNEILLTNESLHNIEFCEKDIYEIIQKLDPHKAHGHDMISFRMLKMCGISDCKTLKQIFMNCVYKGYFQMNGKKQMFYRSFKKKTSKI